LSTTKNVAFIMVLGERLGPWASCLNNITSMTIFIGEWRTGGKKLCGCMFAYVCVCT